MAKSSIAIIFITLIILLAVCLIQMYGSRNKSNNGIVYQILLGLAMNLVFLTSLFTEDKLILSVLYSLVMILEIWIINIIMCYTYIRTHLWKVQKDAKYNALNTVLIIDNLLIIVNLFTESMFKYEIVESGGNKFVCAEWTWFTIAHYGLCLLFAFFVVIVMFEKASQVAKVYRTRYLLGGIVFAIGTVILSASRVISGNMNMFEVFALSLAIFCNFYMYFMYPMHRSVILKNYAINHMTEPLLMFDYNHNLQVFNEAAVRVLQVEAYDTMEEYIEKNQLYYSLDKHGVNYRENAEFTRTMTVDGKTYFIHGQELWDHKKRFVGTLIVYTDISSQERLKNEATLYATRDQLTGLWNRDYFFEVVDKTIRSNPAEEFLVIATDIYRFKIFNEILGTSTGDDLLLAIAQAYRANYKRNWVFSRISGDRFALLIPKRDYEEKGFLDIVHSVFDRKRYSMKVHCYIGVYEVTERSLSAESMYDRAFMALESIKGDMQKEIAYYHEEILNKHMMETTTLDEMDRALLNNEFVIYLQPQVDIESGNVISAEALIRWDKPGRGIVSPGEFIPIFENYGMIAKLDYYVWELACRQLYLWQEFGHNNRSISVNISAKDFYLADLYESITGLVEKYDVNPANLKLEITETAFVLDVGKQMELVNKLQEYGFIIEIDDFGSGYSSLNSLKDINVDVLKMDLKFFEKTGEDDRAEKIVTSVIRLANDLGMPVIAEGVENEEDLEMLKRVGCQVVQGYYYAKPMAVSQYEEFIQGREGGSLEEIIHKIRNNG